MLDGRMWSFRRRTLEHGGREPAAQMNRTTAWARR